MKALEGLKVVDFTWSIAGPLTTKFLADYGATVVRVESATHPDFIRVSGPYKDRRPGLDRSGYFAFFSPNKYSLALNMNHPEAGKVVRRLVEWGDVIADNFTPGIMTRWNLDYEHVKQINPDAICLSISQMGQTGPLRTVSGTGTNLVGMTGFTSITGWPDREPVQPFGGYPDFISAVLAACSLLGSLIYWRRTGKGQKIDVSQLEASLQFLAPLVLEHSVTGIEPGRHGDRSDFASPNGVYRCKGDDRWCSISVSTEEEWKGFAKALDGETWAHDARFSNLALRKKNEDELDMLVNQWTSRHTAENVMHILQENGVPAGVMQDPSDLVRDLQLAGLNTFWKLPQSEIGETVHLGELFHLPLTPAEAVRAAPSLGEHTEYVCRNILQMPEDEFTDLLLKGLLE